MNKREWLERTKSIGGSDCAAILGKNPYKSAYDVWLEKTGKISYDDAHFENQATLTGKRLEPALIDFAESETGLAFLRNMREVSDEYPFLSAQFDGLTDCKKYGCEAKTSGIGSRGFPGDWGDPEEDETDIPEAYLLQCYHQLIIVPTIQYIVVPALIAGRGMILFRVHRNDEIQQAILEAEYKFWRDHVMTDTPPDTSGPSIDYAKKMPRFDGKIATIDSELVDSWREAAELRKAAQKQEDALKARVIGALGDADRAIAGDAGVTYKGAVTRRIDTKMLKERHPEIAEEVTRESVTRRLIYKSKGL